MTGGVRAAPQVGAPVSPQLAVTFAVSVNIHSEIIKLRFLDNWSLPWVDPDKNEGPRGADATL